MREAVKFERTILSEHDSLLVVSLLENPAAPNAKLKAAIAALPRPKRKRDEPV
jgi:uncharacterized protein (DUF1778 family)